MMPIRLRKVGCDLRLRWGRTLLTLAGLTLGLFGVATVSVALGMLHAGMGAAYESTLPPDVRLDTDPLPAALMQQLASTPGLAAIDQRIQLVGRIETAHSGWMTLILTVADDAQALPVARYFPNDGAWPAPTGALLLERDARFFFDVPLNSPLRLRLPDGRVLSAPLAGHAYDPGLPPARMEELVYGSVTRATLETWQYRPARVQLLARASVDSAQARRVLAGRLKQAVQAAGITVHRSEAIVLREHPHQFQLDSINAILIGLAAVAWLMCAVLTINLIDAIMVREQRSIGVLKALGARSGQIALDYLLGMAALGGVASLLSLPLAVITGRAIAQGNAGMLNFDLLTPDPSPALLAGVIAAGTLSPVLVAAWRIARTASRPVREALSRAEIGLQVRSSSPRVRRLSAALPMVPRIALRTLLRAPRRALLTAAVLALGLLCFISALNLRESMLGTVGAMLRARPYDLAVSLRHGGDAAALARWVQGFDKVRSAEFWSATEAEFDTAGDGAWPAVPLIAVPAGPIALRPEMTAGEWLDTAQPRGVVITQQLLARRPELGVGTVQHLRVGSRSVEVHVIGVIKEFGPPAVYAPAALAGPLMPEPGQPNLMLLTLSQSSLRAELDVAGQLEASLVGRDVQIVQVQPGRMLEAIIKGHLEPMAWLLFAVSCVALVVGALGLASSISVSIVERTREVGVLKAIGASSRVVAGLFIGEALLVAVIAWALAAALSPLASRVLNAMLGEMVVHYPFDYRSAAWIPALGLAAAVGVALLGSAGPIRHGLRSTIHEALRTG